VTELSRYRLEVLRKDDAFVLYRGRNHYDESHILVLSPAEEYPVPDTLKRLEHEYSLRAELEAAWAARPIAITHHWDRPVLVLDDPGGVPLDQLLGQPSEVAVWLRLAVSLGSAIGRLHRHGIIHKDIKPANVLADLQSGRCWVKGFGIASRLPRERQPADPPELVAGTLAYMAPEQTGRMNRSVDSRSDLYSLGVTLYEVLTGTLPFTASDPMEWVHCHVAKQPVAPSERCNSVPASVSAVIMKLLAKTAEERYQTAAGVEHDLRRCLELIEGSSGGSRTRHSRSISSQIPASAESVTADPRDPLRPAGSRLRQSAGKTPLYTDATSERQVALRGAGDEAQPIAEFPLGEQDVPDRLLIPEKLYGRAREIDALLASFDRVVASGTCELVLVSGYSGIGKSSIVNELHKALVLPRGLFASGKFDQYKRDVPYSILAQAFQDLIRPLLGKSDAELSEWRDALQEALDPNGQLMVDLVPELALILGKQPPVPELPPQDAQRRFQLLFRRFISVFAKPEHPLTLFLDDLQWLDAATLDLIEDLLSPDFAQKPGLSGPEEPLIRATQLDVQHLLLIGAYRDNEVNPGHPLMRRLEAIRRAGTFVQEITLAPLSREDLEELIAETLRCAPDRVTQLALMVHEKTGGNPFFAIQFITTLSDEGLLSFDHDMARWSWDLARIQAKGYTDNVVELMLGKLNRLPDQTQRTVKEFACLGNSADAATLSIVLGTTEKEVHADLWEALRLGFIVRSDGLYQFIHDRVQEAAYLLIPEELRTEAHLRIGRQLYSRMMPEATAEDIFRVVNQLNAGARLITERTEKERVAELNLAAGQKTKASAAYDMARDYFALGVAMVGRTGWERCYDLARSLWLELAECEFLTGNIETAESLISEVLERSKSKLDKAAAYQLRVQLCVLKTQNPQAVDVALECLGLFGIEMLPHPTSQQVQKEYEEVWKNLNGRSIESLIELPRMSDPEMQAAMSVLSTLSAPAMNTDSNLFRLLVCHMVNVSIEYGITAASTHGYAWFGVILGPVFHRYNDGYRFGKLAVALVEKHDFRGWKAKVYYATETVLLWTQPLTSAIDFVRAAFRAGIETGDLTFACYSSHHLVIDLLLRGERLDRVWLESTKALDFARDAKFRDVADCVLSIQRFVQRIRGQNGKFAGNADDESTFEAQLLESPMPTKLCWYWILRLSAHFMFADYAAAIAAAQKARTLLWASEGHIQLLDYFYYTALSAAAFRNQAPPDKQGELLDLLTQHVSQLKEWAENCPSTFLDKYALAAAELARIEGRELDAERFYEQAIRSAREHDFISNEGLASELAARFYAARGFEKIANTYMRDARYCFLRWGADGKVRQLDELYPDLREEGREMLSQRNEVPDATITIGASVEHLDLGTVIKVSQAISGEIVLEKLIDTLMRTAIEHAGAQRGVLILQSGSEQRVQTEATTNGGSIVVHRKEPPEKPAALPESIVHYVTRTHETVILDDASRQNSFSEDAYIRRHHTRSVLCIPLINQAKLIGVLYLENNLASQVFTPARITVLRLLASQAAISLENTRLYRDLEMREAKIRRLVDANIIGIHIWNLEGEIVEANGAFLRMLGYSREDLFSGPMRWAELTPAEWSDRDQHAVAEIVSTGIFQPFEKEYFRKDGSRVPVLIGGVVFEGSGNEGVAFVLDLSEQKRAEGERKTAEEALQRMQAELAHITRVTTLGELTASLAHEISQPLAAILTNANAGMRWLTGDSPNLVEVHEAVRRIARDGKRAGDVIARVRALFKKAPAAKEPTEINEIIQEVLAVTQHEVQRNRVSLRTELGNDLPIIMGDKVQLQQVILNLLVNAIEAVSGSAEGPRDLRISSRTAAGISPDNTGKAVAELDRAQLLVAVEDSGPGLDPNSLGRLFDAFYTTKPQGLGMGLAISRSIIEAHGGRLWAMNALPRGAVFQFTLPIPEEQG
jgi:PAS domain S-box-containing protein